MNIEEYVSMLLEPKKHLNYYKTCLKKGFMPSTGLCSAAEDGLISKKLLLLFEPTPEDKWELLKENKNNNFWGSDDYDSKYYMFTALRQTIVLLMAAINNEL